VKAKTLGTWVLVGFVLAILLALSIHINSANGSVLALEKLTRQPEPESVIPGGVTSKEEVAASLFDPVIRQHSKGIDVQKLRPLVLTMTSRPMSLIEKAKRYSGNRQP
jgi:hypothetical protein